MHKKNIKIVDLPSFSNENSIVQTGLLTFEMEIHPVVLGHGKPFFAGPRPRLKLLTTDLLGEDVIRLTYVPA